MIRPINRGGGHPALPSGWTTRLVRLFAGVGPWVRGWQPSRPVDYHNPIRECDPEDNAICNPRRHAAAISLAACEMQDQTVEPAGRPVCEMRGGEVVRTRRS